METPNLDAKANEYGPAQEELIRLKAKLAELEAKYAQLVPGKH